MMTCDIERILRETWIAKAEHHPSLTSTNDRAKEYASRGEAVLPFLVTADHQTAGRGRGANRWWTGSGALAFSLAVEPESVGAGAGPSPLVSLAVGVAVVEAITPLLPGRVGLHWPNDVMVDGRKICGILIEVLPNRRYIVGVGVNTNNTIADAPTEICQQAATLRDLMGAPCHQTDVLAAILNQLGLALRRLRATPSEVALRANELCLQQGLILTLDHAGQTVTGRCRGIANDGALRLETPAGERLFYSGVLRKIQP